VVSLVHCLKGEAGQAGGQEDLHISGSFLVAYLGPFDAKETHVRSPGESTEGGLVDLGAP